MTDNSVFKLLVGGIRCSERNFLLQVYKYTHNQDIATTSTAQMLSNMLYAKRFFPYYVSNVLVSWDFFRLGWFRLSSS